MTTAFDWTGRVGDSWADEWRRTDRSLAELGDRLVEVILAVAPERGHAIDIGCGAGATSIALARARPHLVVTGIDLSPALIDISRRRAGAQPNAVFETSDAASLSPEKNSDLIVSRHGVMFFDDPVAAFSALRRAARPRAKLVFSCFGPRTANEWALAVDEAVGNKPGASTGYVPGPFAFADPALTGDMLRRAGWNDASAEATAFTYIAGAGEDPVEDALDFLSRIGPAARALADARPEQRQTMRDSLRCMLAKHRRDGMIAFRASAWIWTATAGGAA